MPRERDTALALAELGVPGHSCTFPPGLLPPRLSLPGWWLGPQEGPVVPSQSPSRAPGVLGARQAAFASSEGLSHQCLPSA